MEPELLHQQELLKNVVANLNKLQEDVGQLQESYLRCSGLGQTVPPTVCQPLIASDEISHHEDNVEPISITSSAPLPNGDRMRSLESAQSKPLVTMANKDDISGIAISSDIPGLIETENPMQQEATLGIVGCGDTENHDVLTLRKIWCPEAIRMSKPRIWSAIEATRKKFHVVQSAEANSLERGASRSLMQSEESHKSIFRRSSRIMEKQAVGKLKKIKSTPQHRDCVLHPDSDFKVIWEVSSLMLIMYDVIVLPMQVFNYDSHTLLDILNWIAAIFWTSDLLLSFRTGYYVGTHVEMRQWRVAQHYLKSWFVFDLTIAILEWLSQFMEHDLSINALRLRGALQLTKFTRLVRMVKMRSVWGHIVKVVKNETYSLLLSLTCLCIFVLVTLHVFACIWYGIGRSNSKGWITYDEYEGEKNLVFWYMASARWVVAQLNGRTDMNPRRTMVERNFTVFCGLILGVVVISLFVSMITRTTFELSEVSANRRRRDWFMLEYLVSYNIDKSVECNIRQYLYDRDESSEQQEAYNVIAILPKHVQQSLFLEIRGPVLCGCGALNALRQYKVVFRELCTSLVHPLFCVTDEVLFKRQDACIRMLAVDRGTLCYAGDSEIATQRTGLQTVQTDWTAQGETADAVEESSFMEAETTTLDGTEVRPGDLVSEAALWYDWHNRGNLVAMEVCTIYEVRVRELQNLFANNCTYTRGEEPYAVATVYAEKYAQVAGNMYAVLDDLTRIHLQVKRAT